MAQKNFDQLIASVVLWWSSFPMKVSVKGITNDNELLPLTKFLSPDELVTEEKIKKFQKLLTEFLEKQSKEVSCEILSTDKEVEKALAEICHESGVHSWYFPKKTIMVVDFTMETATWRIVRGPSGQIYPSVEQLKKEEV